MILYLDTSALLKKYFEEVGSDQIISMWVEATGIVTSSVAYAETMASCYRKKRELDMNGELFEILLDSFQNDWKSFIRVADRYYGTTHDRGYGASSKRPKNRSQQVANLAFFTSFRKYRF